MDSKSLPLYVSIYHAFGDCTVENWLPFTEQQSRTECVNYWWQRVWHTCPFFAHISLFCSKLGGFYFFYSQFLFEILNFNAYPEESERALLWHKLQLFPSFLSYSYSRQRVQRTPYCTSCHSDSCSPDILLPASKEACSVLHVLRCTDSYAEAVQQ